MPALTALLDSQANLQPLSADNVTSLLDLLTHHSQQPGPALSCVLRLLRAVLGSEGHPVQRIGDALFEGIAHCGASPDADDRDGLLVLFLEALEAASRAGCQCGQQQVSQLRAAAEGVRRSAQLKQKALTLSSSVSTRVLVGRVGQLTDEEVGQLQVETLLESLLPQEGPQLDADLVALLSSSRLLQRGRLDAAQQQLVFFKKEELLFHTLSPRVDVDYKRKRLQSMTAFVQYKNSVAIPATTVKLVGSALTQPGLQTEALLFLRVAAAFQPRLMASVLPEYLETALLADLSFPARQPESVAVLHDAVVGLVERLDDSGACFDRLRVFCTERRRRRQNLLPQALDDARPAGPNAAPAPRLSAGQRLLLNDLVLTEEGQRYGGARAPTIPLDALLAVWLRAKIGSAYPAQEPPPFFHSLALQETCRLLSDELLCPLAVELLEALFSRLHVKGIRLSSCIELNRLLDFVLERQNGAYRLSKAQLLQLIEAWSRPELGMTSLSSMWPYFAAQTVLLYVPQLEPQRLETEEWRWMEALLSGSQRWTLEHLILLHVTALQSLLQLPAERLSQALEALGCDTERQLLSLVCKTVVLCCLPSECVEQLLQMVSTEQAEHWLPSMQQLAMRRHHGEDLLSQRSRKTELALSQLWALLQHLNPDVSLQMDRQLQAIRSGEMARTGAFFSETDRRCPVQQWDAHQLLNWTRSLRRRRQEEKLPPLQDDPAMQIECLAVINRAFLLLPAQRPLRAVQLLAVLALLQPRQQPKSLARLAQVSTGEGKSMIIAALAAMLALYSRQVDVITSSPLLARRDARDFAAFYQLLGLRAEHNNSSADYLGGLKDCYRADVLYGNASDFQYDCLRHKFSLLDTRGTRQFDVAIVDEADSMMLDEGAKIAMLAADIPAMDHLLSFYLLIWTYIQQLHFTYDRLQLDRPDKDQLSFEQHVALIDQRSLCAELLMVVIRVFLQQMQARRLHAPVDRRAAFSALAKEIIEKRITALFVEMKEAEAEEAKQRDNEEDRKQAAPAAAAAAAAPAAADHLNARVLRCPQHLRGVVASQLSKWLDNAVIALLEMQRNKHYVLAADATRKMRVCPVDFPNTGVTQMQSQWADGLHQFLQLKEQVELTAESVSTNFLSNIAFFSSYQSCLGMTGTLGSAQSRALLGREYCVDFLELPRYRQRRFQQYEGQLCASVTDWLRAIVASTKDELAKGRCVLLVCQTISDAQALYEQLGGEAAARLTLCCRSDGAVAELSECELDSRDVLIATNLAGRGTDVKLSPRAQQGGGLHVCLTYLPSNVRVEEQALGRAARQDQPGTGELIVNVEDLVHPLRLSSADRSASLDQLRQRRDMLEASRLLRLQQRDGQLDRVKARDEIFEEFCGLLGDVKKRMTESASRRWVGRAVELKRVDLTLACCVDSWGYWLKTLSPTLSPQELHERARTFLSRPGFWPADDAPPAAQAEAAVTVAMAMHNPAYQLQYANRLLLFINTPVVFSLASAVGAADCYEKLLASAQSVRDPLYRPQAANLIAYVHLHRGDRAAALTEVVEAERLLESDALPYWRLQQYLASCHQASMTDLSGLKQLVDSSLFQQMQWRVLTLSTALAHLRRLRSVLERSQKLVSISRLQADDRQADIAPIAGCSRLTRAAAATRAAEQRGRLRLSFHDLRHATDVRYYTRRDWLTVAQEVLLSHQTAQLSFQVEQLSLQHFTELRAAIARSSSLRLPCTVHVRGVPGDVLLTWMAQALAQLEAGSCTVRFNSLPPALDAMVRARLQGSLSGSWTLSPGAGGPLELSRIHGAIGSVTAPSVEQLLRDRGIDQAAGWVGELRVTDYSSGPLCTEHVVRRPQQTFSILYRLPNDQSPQQQLPDDQLPMARLQTLLQLSKRHLQQATLHVDPLAPQQASQLLIWTTERGRVCEEELEAVRAVHFKDELQLHSDSISLQHAMRNGWQYLLQVKERTPFPVFSTLLLSAIIAAEVAAGAGLLFFCPMPFFASVGLGLMLEGVTDMVNLARLVYSREIDWANYSYDKVLSLALCVGSAGLSRIARAAVLVDEGATAVQRGAVLLRQSLISSAKLGIREVNSLATGLVETAVLERRREENAAYGEAEVADVLDRDGSTAGNALRAIFSHFYRGTEADFLDSGLARIREKLEADLRRPISEVGEAQAWLRDRVPNLLLAVANQLQAAQQMPEIPAPPPQPADPADPVTEARWRGWMTSIKGELLQLLVGEARRRDRQTVGLAIRATGCLLGEAFGLGVAEGVGRVQPIRRAAIPRQAQLTLSAMVGVLTRTATVVVVQQMQAVPGQPAGAALTWAHCESSSLNRLISRVLDSETLSALDLTAFLGLYTCATEKDVKAIHEKLLCRQQLKALLQRGSLLRFLINSRALSTITPVMLRAIPHAKLSLLGLCLAQLHGTATSLGAGDPVNQVQALALQLMQGQMQATSCFVQMLDILICSEGELWERLPVHMERRFNTGSIVEQIADVLQREQTPDAVVQYRALSRLVRQLFQHLQLLSQANKNDCNNSTREARTADLLRCWLQDDDIAETVDQALQHPLPRLEVLRSITATWAALAKGLKPLWAERPYSFLLRREVRYALAGSSRFDLSTAGTVQLAAAVLSSSAARLAVTRELQAQTRLWTEVVDSNVPGAWFPTPLILANVDLLMWPLWAALSAVLAGLRFLQYCRDHRRVCAIFAIVLALLVAKLLGKSGAAK